MPKILSNEYLEERRKQILVSKSKSLSTYIRLKLLNFSAKIVG